MTCICYIGNSVSAQRNSYKEFLNKRLESRLGPNLKFLSCTLGGIGSLGISFFVDRFIGNNPVDLCFIETFVADLGGATPENYIEASLRGIIEHPTLKNALIVPLYLYRSDTTPEYHQRILDIYTKVNLSYGLNPIDVFSYVQIFLGSNQYAPQSVVYDHIHTTPVGAELYAEYIDSVLPESMEIPECKAPRKNNYIAIRPKSLEPLQNYVCSGSYTKGLFRLTLPYLQIDRGTSLRLRTGDLSCIGLIVIADSDTGVLSITTSDWTHDVQIYDAWCGTPRIQVVILPAIIAPFASVDITASTKSTAQFSANLDMKTDVFACKNIKVAQLMGFDA